MDVPMEARRVSMEARFIWLMKEDTLVPRLTLLPNLWKLPPKPPPSPDLRDRAAGGTLAGRPFFNVGIGATPATWGGGGGRKTARSAPKGRQRGTKGAARRR
eukprot:295622-Prorocentrum_minimum.AAC.1